jgi:glutamate--cysteine ligase
MTPLGPAGISDLFRRNVRDPRARQVGLECERIAVWSDGTPFRYRDPKTHPDRFGAGELLADLEKKYRWEGHRNAQGQLLGFSLPTGKVSLEPGSQLEFAAKPTGSLVEQARAIDHFEKQVSAVTDGWGLHWLSLGVHPLATVDDVDVIPLDRYRIMTEYLGQRDTLGLRMMRLTASVQINLDYASEAEATSMLRAALLLAPLSYALFGHSPFYAGKTAAELSHRGRIWRHTDPDRSGLLPEAFGRDFGFDRYAELAWNRPLMFAEDARGTFVAANGRSLGELVTANQVPAHEANFHHAVRELFFEARLKPGYVEVRSVDGLPPPERYAAAAFWTGALYGESCRAFAETHFFPLGADGLSRLCESAWTDGLEAAVDGVALGALAKAFLPLVEQSLVARKRDEVSLLAPLKRIVEEGQNPAQRALAAFEAHGRRWDAEFLRTQ